MFRNSITLCWLSLFSIFCVSCSNKKEKTAYDTLESATTKVEAVPFEVKISNLDLMTLELIKYDDKKMGDFYKIENRHYKLDGEDKKLLLSKSYLVPAEKYQLVKDLLLESIAKNQEPIVISDTNPVVITIKIGVSGNEMSRELELKAAEPFETALFKLLIEEAAPKAVKIPTH